MTKRFLNRVVFNVLLLSFVTIGSCKNNEQADSHNQSPAVSGGASEKTPDYSTIGMQLMNDDGVGPVKIDLSADEVVAILGNPESKSIEALSEAHGQMHQQWIYQTKGLVLDMFTTDGTQSVGMITATSSCKFKTKRDIGIGADAKTVLSVYKAEIDPTAEDLAGSIIAGSVYGGVIFFIDDGRVSSILIGAVAE